MAAGAINLQFRAGAPSYNIGDMVSVGLYAVGDTASPAQTLSAAEVVFTWQPAYMQLTGLDGTGGAPLLLSTFPVSGSGGLNEAALPADGDGYYRSFGMLGSPITATTSGTLITTFQFQALAATPGTPVDILMSGGSPARSTIVFDGTIPNFNVLGTIEGAPVRIVPAPGVMVGVVSVAGAGLLRRRRAVG